MASVPLHATVGQIMVNEALPEDLRDYTRTIDRKSMRELMRQVADRYPERYSEIAQKLLTVGHQVATSTGGYSFGMNDVKLSPRARADRDLLARKSRVIISDPRKTPEQKSEALAELMNSNQQRITDELYDEMRTAGNPLAMQVAAGAQKSSSPLKSLVYGDGLYVDHRGNNVPMPILKSYAEGLSPAEFWAGTYGGRAGIIATKLNVRDAGALSKQLTQTAHRLVTVGHDDDEDRDPEGTRGLPTTVDDTDNVGALLSRPIGGYPRNTPLTPVILHDLKRKGIEHILVRSPLVGGPGDGVWSRDVGMRERGFLPRRGDFVGIAAANAISEPLSQATLGSKHSGGVSKGTQTVTGLPAVVSQVQVPEVIRGGATHAMADGTIDHIEKAPQGGQYVYIGKEQHHIPEGQSFLGKPGDAVEAGDVLSTGLPNPREAVEHKHIGEGRRYFVESMMKTLKDSGAKAHRRNVELLGRGLINHVRLTEDYGDHFADDIVPYQQLERDWQPREGAVAIHPKKAIGMHLERPILHYSIGTKIKPSMVKTFGNYGINQISAHPDPPPFAPEMTRAMGFLEKDPDWVVRHLGSGLQKSTLAATHTGAESNPLGTSFVSAMVLNPKGFGREGATAAWKP